MIFIKKAYRVKDTREFKAIMDRKKYYACPQFVIYVKEKKEENARVGISVGKKLGKAFCRNKIKRQVRSMIQTLYSFEEDFDTIVIVRNKYLENSYEENFKYLQKLYKKVKL